jgi:hypothetical protein
MPNIKLSIEQSVYDKLQTIAEFHHVSVAEWISKIVSYEIEAYSKEFIHLAGSLSELDLVREDQTDYLSDSKREPL